MTPPGTLEPFSTTAPAPSPKSTQVLRSCQSRTRDIVSEPMTTALRTAPVAMDWDAICSA